MLNKPNLLHEKMEHSPAEKPIRSSDKFSEQEVDLQKTPFFFPKGYENIFLTLYFIFLPYIVGILFLFLYASKGKVEFFLSVNELSSVIVTWSIGYEIIAVLIVLYVIKMAFSFNTSKKKEPFQRP
ncbi:MAG: hypothetical protein KC427_08955 [Sulfurovum sp.]|uniref:hypothetical protein n=1 Tax=Sulfurovum sp. TaxID=1969726 RepID=UPI00286812D8|nr:hypothetical protein [Sulfurovum sp.]MCO4846132.1 hypothetical protein [Sulfurovum sp.]